MKTRLLLFFFLLAFELSAQSVRSDSLFAAGVNHYNQGQYRDAIEAFTAAGIIDEEELTGNPCRMGYSRAWLAHCYFMAGDEDTAGQIADDDYHFKPVDRRLTVESDSLAMLAAVAEYSGNTDEAIALNKRCLALEIKNLGENSHHVAGSFRTLGNLFNAKELPDSALYYYTKGIDIEKSVGRFNDNLSFLLHLSRAELYLASARYNPAENDIESLKKIADYYSDGDEAHFTVMVPLILNANLKIATSDFPVALQSAKEAFDVGVKCYTPDNEILLSELVKALEIMAVINQKNETAELLVNALPFLKAKGLSKIHEGVLYRLLGATEHDPKLSDQYFERSLELFSVLGDKEQYFTTLKYLATYSMPPEKAIPAFQSIIDYYSASAPDTFDANYIDALTEIGNVYFRIGEFCNSLRYYKLAYDIIRPTKGTPEFLIFILKMWPAYHKASEYYPEDPVVLSVDNSDFVDVFSDELQKIADGQFAKDCILRVGMYPFFNELLQYLNYAVPLLKNNTDNREQITGLLALLTSVLDDYLIPSYTKEDPTSVAYLNILAFLYSLQGNYDKAISIATEVIEISERRGYGDLQNYHDSAFYKALAGDFRNAFIDFEKSFRQSRQNLLHNFHWMTAAERENHLAYTRGHLDAFLEVCVKNEPNADYAALAYDNLLFYKGLLLNSSIGFTRLLKEANDATTLALIDELRQLDAQYKASLTNINIDQSNLRQKRDECERKLADRVALYGDFTFNLETTYPSVQQNLGENDIAVELAYCNPDSSNDLLYLAFVVGKNMAPRTFALGKFSEWGPMIDSCFSSPDLFNSLFPRLRELFPDKSEGKIYFAPDGVFHVIALENIKGAEDYDFVRLSSTRELALTQNPEPSKLKSLSVWGGVQYGLGEFEEFYQTGDSSMRESETFLTFLPGTKAEAEEILKITGEKMDCEMFLGKNATESNFKRLSGNGTDILHIATHGFIPQKVNGTSNFDLDLRSSGLYLAGAQNTLWGEKLPDGDPEDGILTSLEISQMDLRGLRLAVLSACDTGLGTIYTDGVFGLQRAFKQAGAESIIMSLWKVDDTATKELMIHFYSFLSQGLAPAVALRKAQTELKKSRPDPRFWAAFVIIDP